MKAFVPTAALAIATTFGTASTGTAIATLSGAAHAPQIQELPASAEKIEFSVSNESKHSIKYTCSFSQVVSFEECVRSIR
ncbi:hypothetical protein EHJ16_05820 [Cronobacter dublinensis]|nr:hypothetical protein [Cronobacter dublinensis]